MRVRRLGWIVVALAWWPVLALAGSAARPGAEAGSGPVAAPVAVEEVVPAEALVTGTPAAYGPRLERVDRDALLAPRTGAGVTIDARAAAPMPATTTGPAPTVPSGDDFLYVPPSAMARQPVTVLVALHGVGAEGRGFCSSLLAEADRNGWVVVAPTYRYENWHDPAAVVRDDLTILPRLKAAIDAVPERTGLRVRDRVLLYGFSRGGQVAHRFALAYPHAVLGVATLSAGTYTLPTAEWTVNGTRRPLPLPFGTAGLGAQLGVTPQASALERVAFWVGVGEQDNRAADAPVAWTPYIGPNRVERARAFAAALLRQGIRTELTIFPGVDHTETPAMRAAASAFLRDLANRARTQDVITSDSDSRSKPV
jgi:poly(3-hydroxybutyrate) depolymerase